MAQITQPDGTALRDRRWAVTRVDPGALLFGLAACSVPVSIAIAEIFLGGALAVQLVALARGRSHIEFPPVFRWWMLWAIVECAVWLHSPQLRAGLGEIRHLLLIAALFVASAALRRDADRVLVWCGLMWTATASSCVLIWHFVRQAIAYRGSLAPVVYLRSGGLLHHWMLYAVVEIIVFAGLLELWRFYPEKRRWLAPLAAIQSIAILLSMTRTLWLCCSILLALHLISNRSKWIWSLALLPGLVYLLAPAAVRSRITESSDPEYYANAERIQMVRVGWRMIRAYPFTGVGPGRAGELYTQYLEPSDPVPAYHGHLHNNLVQIAAELGIPVTAAALAFLYVLYGELITARKFAQNRDRKFLSRAALLSLTGFLAAGLFDYTYGHSLGLILLSFAVCLPWCRTPEPESRGGARGGT